MAIKYIFGTSHFVSIPTAKEYFINKGYDADIVASVVDERVNSGEINIGPPVFNKQTEELKINKEEGRYFIAVKVRD